MRKLLLALLLLPLQSWAALVVSSRCWEPDGPYVETAQHGARCPAQLVSQGATAVTDSGYTVGYSTTKNSGTAYFYTSTSDTPPARKAHKSGAGAVAHSTSTITATGAQTKAITGLGDDAQYYTHVMHEVSGYPSNRLTIAQRTAETSPGGGAMTLSGYFIGTGGSDFAAGTSHAARLATLAPYKALTPATGTDLWLQAGWSAQNTQLDTKHGGSSGDPAYIGCYEVDGATPMACWEHPDGGTLDTDDWDATTLGTLTMPRLYGSLTDACIKPAYQAGHSGAPNCVWPSPTAQGGAGPTADCAAIEDFAVEIRHSYVRWRGIGLEKWACFGMQVKATTENGFIHRDGVIIEPQVQDSYFRDMAGAHAFMRSGVKYWLFKNNIMVRNSLCRESRLRGGSVPSITSGSIIQTCNWWVFGSAVTFSLNSYGAYIGNLWGYQQGEGLGILQSSYALMHGNKGGNNATGGTYCDNSSNCVQEVALNWGNNGNSGMGGSGPSSGGGRIALGAEAYGQTPPFNMVDNLVRNTIAINFVHAHEYFQQFQRTFTHDLDVIHNTTIASVDQPISAINNLTGYLQTSSKLQNNMWADPTYTTFASGCAAEWDQGYNLFAKATSGNCTAGTDVGGGASTDPQLALNVGSAASPNTTNIATWRAASITNIPDATLAKSSATKAGARFNNVYCPHADTVAERNEWKKVLVHVPGTYYDNDGNGEISDTEIEKFAYCAYYDFGGNVRADTPRAGAWEVAP